MDVWAVGAGGLTSGSTVAGTGTGLPTWMQVSSLKEIGRCRRGRFMRVMESMIRAKRARWVQGPSRPGRTVKHLCAIILVKRLRLRGLLD